MPISSLMFRVRNDGCVEVFDDSPVGSSPSSQTWEHYDYCDKCMGYPTTPGDEYEVHFEVTQTLWARPSVHDAPHPHPGECPVKQ